MAAGPAAGNSLPTSHHLLSRIYSGMLADKDTTTPYCWGFPSWLAPYPGCSPALPRWDPKRQRWADLTSLPDQEEEPGIGRFLRASG